MLQSYKPIPASLGERYGEQCSVATAPDVPPHTLQSEAARQAFL